MKPYTNTERFCHNCTHWKWDDTIYIDGTPAYPGRCALQSATCINEVSAWYPGAPSKPKDFQKLEVPVETT